MYNIESVFLPTAQNETHGNLNRTRLNIIKIHFVADFFSPGLIHMQQKLAQSSNFSTSAQLKTSILTLNVCNFSSDFSDARLATVSDHC